MKIVPIHVLKQKLAALVNEASAGEHIVVTRHNTPVACLLSNDVRHVHIGRNFGAATLKPLLRRATKNRYLEALKEDRNAEVRGE